MTTPSTDSFITGFRYGSFVVERARDVKELSCRLIEIRHEPSGAHIIHIQNDDPENLFCLSFQTVPYSSNGVAHVLEHLVLCGSDTFPVRDPFFSMSRRSMNTFMNALTGTDFTCYPAASQIKQDFYNLFDVYLDAVFHPILDPLSFMQEAHRLEFSEKGNRLSPLLINGVVYNEMKGSLVKPMRRLMKEMCASLFPNTPYGFDSGGDPKEIPLLTLDEVKIFHQTFYHPSRCLFFFYGNFPLAPHLDILENKILHSAPRLQPHPPIPHQTPLLSPVFKTIEYPIAREESREKKAYIAFGWLTTEIHNQLECLALSLLDIVLLETDASPLKYRLLQSGHCRQVSSSCDTEMQQVPFVIMLTGCEKEDFDPLYIIIRTCLEEVVRERIPMEKIEHALHQLELAKSEIGSDGGPFGLSLYSRAALLAHYGEDPMRGLQIHGLFNELRETLSSDPFYFSKLIQKYFLDNQHCVRIVMLPSSDLEHQEQSLEAQRLKQMRSSLDDTACQTILQQADQLRLFQEQEQDLSCLPSIHLRDVPKKCRHIPLLQEPLENIELFSHETFTNDLVYLDIVTPLPRIAKEDLWLVRLFTSLLPQLGCGTRNYQESLEYLQAYTGGVYASLSLNAQATNPLEITPSWHLKGKALGRNAVRLCDILNDFLLSPNFTDRHRIQELLEKRYTDLENTISQHALDYATSRANAPLSEPHYISEQWYGLSYLQHIRDLVTHYSEQEDCFLEKMGAIQQAMLKNEGVHIVACCDGPTMTKLKEEGFYGLTEIPKKPFHPWDAIQASLPHRANQGYIISSSVSFTVAITKTACYTTSDAPRLAVLSQLLNDTFLHRQLREQGGAYGGGAAANAMAGTFSFYSYKDPNLYSTLEAYEASLQFILSGAFNDIELEEAKLGVLQDLDSPIAPGSRAEVAYAWWKTGKTEGMRQRFRDLLMQAKAEDIQALIPKYFPQGWSKNAFVAFAGKELLEKERPIFEKHGRAFEILPT
jgi:Zn-dependent M16 (insulinase) family peptidase